MIRFSRLKQKLRALSRNSSDPVKFLFDIIFPDLTDIEYFNIDRQYFKGDKIYKEDFLNQSNLILVATEDTTIGMDFDPLQWKLYSVSGSLENIEVVEKLGSDIDGNLTFNNKVVKPNIPISEIEPDKQYPGDLWFHEDGDGSIPEPPPGGKYDSIMIKNMIVQDDEPDEKDVFWGDIEL